LCPFSHHATTTTITTVDVPRAPINYT